MAVAATLLFGSLARADQSEGSDTDLLMICLDEATRRISIGHLSLFLYPWRKLEQDARDGDLFVCHLVREAKPLIDPDSYLPRLQQAFQFRATYAAEIARASDFGWFLVSFGAELNPQLLTKRALWCIRTILIARSAEQRDPVFAPERLSERTSSATAKDLLLNRRSLRDSESVRYSLRQFLVDDGMADRAFRARRPAHVRRAICGDLQQGRASDTSTRGGSSGRVYRIRMSSPRGRCQFGTDLTTASMIECQNLPDRFGAPVLPDAMRRISAVQSNFGSI